MPHNGCPCQCSFCNQNRITGVQKQPTPQEVERIIEDSASYMGESVKSAEIAFFGGSFTAIDRNYMISLLEVAHKAVKKYGFIGIRCSTRPDKIDEEVLTILKRYSVSSIELGAQSMSDKVLFLNDRGHSSEDVVKASALIKSFGFELGLQMMTGLYGSSFEDDIITAEKLIAIHPATVRIYPTITLENTRLADLYRAGEYTPPSLEDTVSLCAKLISMFEDKDIRVIRVGLHATDEITDKRVAGPYHPAFKELCMSASLLTEVKEILLSRQKGSYIINCSPKLTSAIIGQRRSNILELEVLGYYIKVVPDKTTERFVICS
ncbi:MAG: radical SAM protein [Clostridia bacterium]|nr:radical SAM protein [Clostridia bacterium]